MPAKHGTIAVMVFKIQIKMEENMSSYIITNEKLANFERYLWEEEYQSATIEKYMRNVRFFGVWLSDREITKETVTQWKAYLQREGYAPCTVNSRLAALNRFFSFAKLEGCRVKFLHIQRRAFREDRRDLTKEEYARLVTAAKLSGNERLELVTETIGGTGIRVSELSYITVEAVKRGHTMVDLKGKVRMILLPEKLRKKLFDYAERNGIRSGEIFRTKSGKGLSRRQIWREMKELAKKAGVEGSKVFPHNLRHLFATIFYKACGDIVKLADVLGHNSIETTRIYLMTTGREYAQQIDMLGFVM